MPYLIAVLGGFVFGAGIQYLGSLTAGVVLGTWAWTVSAMSAPWLLLPFVAGMTQDRRRRAMALGLVATLAGLAGYFAMAHSPFEGVPLNRFVERVLIQIRTGYNLLWIAAGLFTGPLFGYLGHRWRVSRWWVSGVIITAALCLEPLARHFTGRLFGRALAWTAEIMAGLLVGAWFISVLARRRPRASAPA